MRKYTYKEKKNHKKSLALDLLDDEGIFKRLSVSDVDDNDDDEGVDEASSFDNFEEVNGVDMADDDRSDLFGVGV